MRTPFVVIGALVLLGLLPPALASPPSIVPRGWNQLDENAQTKTRRFASADGEGTLTTMQIEARPLSKRSDMDQIAYRDNEQVTYQRRGSSWIAVSGYTEGKIFYRKANLACSGRRWNIIEFRYPRSEKTKMDT